MNHEDVSSRLEALHERMCELDQELQLLERRHTAVLAQLAEVGEAIEGLIGEVVADRDDTRIVG